MAVVTICSDFEAQKDKVCHCFHCFPSICHEVMGLDVMISVFWMLSFSLFSFTFIKRLFSSSSLSAIRVMTSAYLRLLQFLPAFLIPACASSRQAFQMMYSAYKLNKQGDNIQPWRTPFPIWNQSVIMHRGMIGSIFGHWWLNSTSRLLPRSEVQTWGRKFYLLILSPPDYSSGNQLHP